MARLAADPDPPTPVVNLALRPGLRIEQIAAYLQQQKEETGLALDPKEFLDLARNPRPELFDEYRFLRQMPEGNSLEGFLAGGVYPVPIDINADEFLHLLLQQWEEDSGDLVTQARKKGIDFYDALTIASLVEREVKVDADRAASRASTGTGSIPSSTGATGGLMQADPTVVYATDTHGARRPGPGQVARLPLLGHPRRGRPGHGRRQPASCSRTRPTRHPGLPGLAHRDAHRGRRSRPPSTPNTQGRPALLLRLSRAPTRTRSPRPPRSTAATSPSAS